MEWRVILVGTPHASSGLKNTNTRRGGEIIIAILVGFAQAPGDDVERERGMEVQAGGAQSGVQGTPGGPRAVQKGALSADKDHLFLLIKTVI